MPHNPALIAMPDLVWMRPYCYGYHPLQDINISFYKKLMASYSIA